MTDNQSTNQRRYDRDTISLVDLIAVVLRHRNLILFGSIFICASAIGVLYIGPSIGLEIGPQTLATAEQRILINQVPTALEQYITVDPAAAVRTIAENPQVVGEVYRAFEDTPLNHRTQEQYLTMIKERVIGNVYQTNWNDETQILSISYSDNTPQDATEFLTLLLESIAVQLTAQVGPQLNESLNSLDAAIADVERTVAQLVEQAVRREGIEVMSTDEVFALVDRASGPALNSLAEIEASTARIATLATDARSLYSVLGSPTVFEDRSHNRATIVIIATITALILFSFMAFFVEYVRRIRQDHDEISKLVSAWRRD